MAKRQQKNGRIQPSVTTGLVFTLLLVIAIPLALAWAGFTHRLEVKDIWVLGAQLNNEETYRDYLLTEEDSSLLALDMEGAVKSLESNPYIKGVRLSRFFPDVVQMEILERKPIAALNIDPIRLVDKDGVVLPVNHPEMITHMPMLSNFNPASELYPVGQQSLSIKVLDAVSIVDEVMNIFPPLYSELSEVRFNQQDELELVLTQHPTEIYMGTGDYKHKLEVLRQFKHSLPAMVPLSSFKSLDLRFDKQIIAKDWAS